MKKYNDLGVYSDLAFVAGRGQRKLFPLAKPGKKTQKAVREMLGFDPHPAVPKQVKTNARWERDGVTGEAISWSVGYGPRTEAWLLRPAGVKGKLPGVIALHDHGGFKFLGKEKIAEGPNPPDQVQSDWMTQYYGGRAYADELARRGFAVLVPDTFLWGSRKFPIETITGWDRFAGDLLHARIPMQSNPPRALPEEMSRYAWAAVFHEHTVQKYCSVLGTSISGVIGFEDRVAADYLLNRKDVLPGGIGCLGLSGGGLRAGLLQATCPDIRAAVVVGLMSTYEGLLNQHIVSHTWMFYPSPEWSRQGDWPDLVACRAPSPLMVQFDSNDQIFDIKGMKAAHARLAKHYKSVGKPKNYVGEFYPGPHKFDVPMQESAFGWLWKQLV